MFDDREADVHARACDAPVYRSFRAQLRVQALHALAGRRRRRVLKRAVWPAAIGAAASLAFVLSWGAARVPAPTVQVVTDETAVEPPDQPREEVSRDVSAAPAPAWLVRTRELPSYLRVEWSAKTEARANSATSQDAWIVRTRPLPEAITVVSRAVHGIVIRSSQASRIETIDFADLPQPSGGGTYVLVGYTASNRQLLLLESPSVPRQGLPRERPRMP